MHSIWKIYKLLCLILVVFSVSACKKQDPNPELRDPIYSALQSDLKQAQDELKAEESTLETAKKNIKSTRVHSVERKVEQRQIKKSLKKIPFLRQNVKYLTIRLQRRLAESRKSYKIAFKKGERWPDPAEYSAYKANKRLKGANLNWDTRVPKLYKGNPNYIPGQNSSAKEEPPAEGASH